MLKQPEKYYRGGCGAPGNIKIQKNPAIKDWIAENKKMVGIVLIVRKILSSSKRLRVNRKCSSLCYLAKISLFSAFFETEKFFCSTKRIFSPKQTQDAPKKDSNLRLLFFVE